jgi:hypothetical protein
MTQVSSQHPVKELGNRELGNQESGNHCTPYFCLSCCRRVPDVRDCSPEAHRTALNNAELLCAIQVSETDEPVCFLAVHLGWRKSRYTNLPSHWNVSVIARFQRSSFPLQKCNTSGVRQALASSVTKVSHRRCHTGSSGVQKCHTSGVRQALAVLQKSRTRDAAKRL